MKLTVLGCGDAFGAGGRLQTSYHVAGDHAPFLIDCGATALIGMARQGLSPNEVAAIFISHLHGDHFSGLVWWMLHQQHVARRSSPLVVAGPPGIEARFATAAEALFPGSNAPERRRFDLQFVELLPGPPVSINDANVSVFEVAHPSAAPSYALRIEASGRTITFSGDTEWTESLIAAADGADLLLIECHSLEPGVRHHLNWQTLSSELNRLAARRIVVTHMSESMLANPPTSTDPRVQFATDGLLVEM